jgi:Holliday junction resolvase
MNNMACEKDVQKQIIEYLRAIGAVAIRVNSGSFFGEYNGKKRMIRANNTPGCSDILACYKSRFVAVEVKMPGARTDPLRLAKQKSFIDGVVRAGGIGMIVTSLDEVIQKFGEI